MTYIVSAEADAILISGDYTIEGNTLKIYVILVRNDASQGKEIIIDGKLDEPEQVIEQLVEVTMQSLQRLN